LNEDRKELGIKITKIITKTNENVVVKHEENIGKNHRLGDDARSITTCHKYLNGKYF